MALLAWRRQRKYSNTLCSASVLIIVSALTMSTSLARDTGKERTRAIDMIALHSIGGPICAAGEVQLDTINHNAAFWKDYLEEQPVAGIHYVIGRNGAVEASILESQVANHSVRVNSRAIGIELVHRGDGKEPFATAQFNALMALVKQNCSRHDIQLQHIVARSDVDQRTCTCGDGNFARRQDPGPNFPIAELRARVANVGETHGAPGFRPRTGQAEKKLCTYR